MLFYKNSTGDLLACIDQIYCVLVRNTIGYAGSLGYIEPLIEIELRTIEGFTSESIDYNLHTENFHSLVDISVHQMQMENPIFKGIYRLLIGKSWYSESNSGGSVIVTLPDKRVRLLRFNGLFIRLICSQNNIIFECSRELENTSLIKLLSWYFEIDSFVPLFKEDGSEYIAASTNIQIGVDNSFGIFSTISEASPTLTKEQIIKKLKLNTVNITLEAMR